MMYSDKFYSVIRYYLFPSYGWDDGKAKASLYIFFYNIRRIIFKTKLWFKACYIAIVVIDLSKIFIGRERDEVFICNF